MREQSRHILEREARLNRGSLMTEAGAWRERLKEDRPLQNTVTDVREDRARCVEAEFDKMLDEAIVRLSSSST